MSSSKLFIFLHGYNAQGASMQVVDNVFKKISPKNSVFLYPDAPFNVNNSNGYCWFQFVFGDDPFAINEEFIFQSMQQAMPYIKKYIRDALEKYQQFEYKDIILVGFSQGAGLALHASMRLELPICGAISFSGGLANPNNSIQNKMLHKSPLLLIHGLEDPILPYQFSERGYKMLTSAGFDAELHLLKKTAHLITPEAIEIAGKFISRITK